ncbi:methyltransferase domain-containing protein [Paenibacillus sp. NPDC058071]|uniref:methyltransferase domain-containing protein n=1 Tax=Paenibacillus sp. NPDC058071 TaxID=3346326 RepID=UPI0036DBDF23
MTAEQNGLTSIIIVTRNQLALTKQCVESIRRNTAAADYELIVIDNGSDDGTDEWASAQPIAKLVLNGHNAGFPKACNQGLRLSAGRFVMLLNNDTIVTPGWLDGLKQALLSDPSVGAVGPVTNSASYWTEVPASYGTVEELDQFAVSRKEADSGDLAAGREERIKLVGFCLLLRREAYEAAGPLDERFGIGNYEDDDYSLRLRLLGYKLLLCRNVFIHHYGSASFKAEKERFADLIENNKKLFAEKWGFDSEALAIREDRIILLDEMGLLRAETRKEPLRLLEIGCGCGATLLRLKSSVPSAVLYGAERNEGAARVAAAAGFRLVAEIEESGLHTDKGVEPAGLDGIIIGEAAKPLDAEGLKALAGLLKPGGWIVASYPNRHYYKLLLRYLRLAAGEISPPPDEAEGASQLYSVEQAVQLAEEAGLETLHCKLLIDSSEASGSGMAAHASKAADLEALERLASVGRHIEGRTAAERFLLLVRLPGDTAAIGEPSGGEAGEAAMIEQNDVVFSGERLVINRDVKANFTDVYEEHLCRYELASQYVHGLRVLDAACGAGYGTAMLKQAGAVEAVGVDIDPVSVGLASRDYGGAGISFEQSDVLRLPYEDGSFDAVVSFETIEHVANGVDWISESARVLREGGLFIVSTPNRTVTNPPLYFEEQPQNEFHRFEYRTSELLGELLVHYDIEAVYGQNPVDDSRFASLNWLRQSCGLPPGRSADRIMASSSHEPVPLSQFKSSEPMYVIAMCRKKRSV